MNIVQILGRVGRDPETRFTQSGLKVTTFSVAVHIKKGGQEETIWWRVTVWGDRFDKMIQYVKKGSMLVVIGEMNKPNIYNDKEGRPQVGMEVTADIIKFVSTGFPDGRQGQEQSNPNAGYGAAPQSQNTASRDPFADFGSTSQPYAGTTQNGTGQLSNSSQQIDDPIPF